MPNRIPLTSEQLKAAVSPEERVFIVAVPGSGKTTVAAERYGFLRYTSSSTRRRVLGLSFTRSASWELAHRVRQRWGRNAASWPHGVSTLDRLHYELVTHLLRVGKLHWPGGHTALTVLDTWRGQKGARFLLPEQAYRRIATIKLDRITSISEPIFRANWGVGTKEAFENHLQDGICTHYEIRAILRAALVRDDLRGALAEYMQGTTRVMVVDEVFDADDLDVNIILLAGEVGIPRTIVGDPWQALYEFRGARPNLVPRLIREQDFTPFSITESFRFATQVMKHLAADLREGLPVNVATGSAKEVDVVLAAQWDSIWEAGDSVLPLSFGPIDNQTDAAVVLLLDQLVTPHFGRNAIFAAEAMTVLGLDPEIMRVNGPSVLGSVLETLAVDAPGAASSALSHLRVALRELGSPRQLRKLPAAAESDQIDRLKGLACRLRQPTLVAGMTVHQAKGQEWESVGVRLTSGQIARLRRGLSEEDPEDRVLYVALTRACQSVSSV